jgi:ribose transport system substrate-binding protein
MKRLVWLAGLACLVLAGCNGGDKSADTDTGDSKYTIAVIPKGTSHVFWKAVEAGAKRAGDELDVEVIWKGPLKEDDRSQQIQVVEDFISRGVDGICLAPLDSVALRGPVGDAVADDIPVLIFDSGLESDKQFSYVATDNKAAGKMGGERLAAEMGGSGKVILLRYLEGSDSTQQREEGFLEAAAEAGLEVISSNQYAGASKEGAQSKSESLLGKFAAGGTPEFDGIFCPNESATFGMLRALQEAGLAGKVKFVGFDSSDTLNEGLKAGEINALVVQNPEMMGYLSVVKMVDKLNGKDVEKIIDTGAAVVGTDDLDDPEMAKLVGA